MEKTNKTSANEIIFDREKSRRAQPHEYQSRTIKQWMAQIENPD